MVATIVAGLLTALLTWTNPSPEPPPCQAQELTIASSEEKSALLSIMARDYERAVSTPSHCVQIRIERKASGEAEVALARGWNNQTDGPRPDVWSPAASSWIALLGQDLAQHNEASLVPGPPTSLLKSPLVVGMPRPMALALGWPNKRLGWSDLVALARDPRGWSLFGHPEWGSFRLGKTNPTISTSGLHALIGTYVAATGLPPSELTSAQLDNPTTQSFVRGVESSVIHYASTVSTFLLNLQSADDANASLSYVSAIAMEEKEVLDYNEGNPTGDPTLAGKHLPPHIPLVAIYPKDGTLMADHPYAILDAPWVTTAKRQLAIAFLSYLQGPRQQQRFQSVGFRDLNGTPGPEITVAKGFLPDEPATILTTPPGTVLEKIEESWASLRKRARVLIVLEDPSATPLAARESMAAALQAALGQLSGDDQAGLWSFPDGRSSVYRELIPVSAVSSMHSEVNQALLGAPHAAGSAPIALFRTLTQALQAMQRAYDPQRINAIVLVAGGHNVDPADSDIDAILRALENQSENDWIRVFTVADGAQPDVGVLNQIARAAQASSYSGSNAATVGHVFNDVISNF